MTVDTPPTNRATPSAGRLLGALVLTSILLGPFAYLVYGAGLAQGAAAIGGSLILLVVALGVAWAANRGGGG